MVSKKFDHQIYDSDFKEYGLFGQWKAALVTNDRLEIEKLLVKVGNFKWKK